MPLSAIVRNNHQEIIKAADALRDAVKAGSPPSDLGLLRISLANVVRDKLPMHQSILSQINSAMRSQIVAFDRMMEEDRELRLCYSQHIAQWNGRVIEQNPAGYAASVETLVTRLKRHIQMLEIEIYEPAIDLFGIAA